MRQAALQILAEIHRAGGRTKLVDGALCVTPPELAGRFRERIAKCRDAFMALHEPIPADQFEAKMIEIFCSVVVWDDPDDIMGVRVSSG